MMKPSTLNKILLLSRILLPAVLCSLLVLCLMNGYYEYLVILTFGIAIVLFNYGETKYNFILSFLVSVISCYVVFFLSIAISGIIGYLIMGGDVDEKIEGLILGIDINNLLSLIPIAIISPLLMFYSFQIIFIIEKNRYFNIIKWFSILILPFLGIVFRGFFDNSYSYIYWQVVMALALQVIIYQKEITELFKPKKSNNSNIE